MQFLIITPPTMLSLKTQHTTDVITAATSSSVTMTTVHAVTRITTAQRQYQQQSRFLPSMPSSQPLTVDVGPTAGVSSVSVPTVHLATVSETTTTHAPRAIILTNAVTMVTLITAVLSIAAVVLLIRMIRRHAYDDWQRFPADGTATSVSATTEADLLDQVARIYWREVQPAVADTLRFVDVARRTAIFGTVTAFDVFAYKFRTYSDFGSSVTLQSSSVGDRDLDPCDGCGRGPYATLRKVEHLFELLSLCLPPPTGLDTYNHRACSGLRRRLTAGTQLKSLGRHKSASHIGLSFGQCLSILASRTAPVWCDDSRPIVRRAIMSFAGNNDVTTTISEFDASSETDKSLKMRVITAVPYIDSLRLVGHRFRLNVITDCYTSDDDDDLAVEIRLAVDRKFREQIRDVDRRLSDIDIDSVVVMWLTTSVPTNHGRLVDVYRKLRDVCLSVGIVHPGSGFPDPDVADLSPIDCVVLTRHLVRLTCGVAANVRQSAAGGVFGDRFRRIIGDLCVVGASLPPGFHDDAISGRPRSNDQRIGDNVIACAAALTGDLLNSECELTKTVLERVERLLAKQYHRVTIEGRTSGSGLAASTAAAHASTCDGIARPLPMVSGRLAAMALRETTTCTDGIPGFASRRHRTGSTGERGDTTRKKPNPATDVREPSVFCTSSSSSVTSTEGVQVLYPVVGGILETAL